MKTTMLFVSMMATLGLIGTGCNQIKENSIPEPSRSRGGYSKDAVAPSPADQTHSFLSKGKVMGEVTGKRYALIIGNAKYDDENWKVLDNSVNDATDIRSSLESLGGDKRFTVVSFLTNVSHQQMGEAIDKFVQTLQQDSNSVGLFYYAGHGVQIDDRTTGSKNYLIPTDVHSTSEAEVKYNALAVDEVLERMNEAGNQFNIVILDACRQKGGLTRGTRGVDRGGLAATPNSKGAIVIFPTQPETVAQDGTGRNGTFTKHLLTSIQEDGHLSLADMLTNVRQRVSNATNGEQVPQNYDSTMGKFCFLGCQDVQAQQAQQRAEEAVKQAREAQQRAEQALRDAQLKIQQVPSAGMGGEANRQIEEANRRAKEAEIAAQRAREEARLAQEKARKSTKDSREEMEIPPSF